MTKAREKRDRINAEKEKSRELLARDNLKRQAQEAANDTISLDDLLYHALFIDHVDYGTYRSKKFKIGSRNHHRRAMEIARQLFGPYRVPKILNSVWNPLDIDSHAEAFARAVRLGLKPIPGEKLDVIRGAYNATNRLELTKFRNWYITISNGGSFYKEHAKEFLTRKEAHTFLECPFDLDVVEAIKYSIALNAGASVGCALRIAKCKIQFFRIALDRWRDVIRFFARETPPTINEIDDIIDWIDSKFVEDNDYRISGHGYTLDSVRNRVKDWHYALRRVKALGDMSWDGHPIENFAHTKKSQHDKQNQVWTITQILNTKELAAEGTDQHHCVYSYRTSCTSGACSIWSLKVNGGRKLTIELRNDGTIVQIRGYANRRATGEEMNIVGMWAAKNLLTIKNW